MADWIRFHRELCIGNKRAIPRALRFIYLEVSLEAKRKRGYVVLPVGMDPVSALHDRLGGNRGEIEKSVKAFTSGQEPMWRFATEDDELRLYVHEWGKWNPIDPTGSERQARRRGGKSNGADRDNPEDASLSSNVVDCIQSENVTTPSARARANLLSLSSPLDSGSSDEKRSKTAAVDLGGQHCVQPDDVLPDLLRESASILGVRDIDTAWLKFTGKNAGKWVHLSGAWQSFCASWRGIETRETPSGPRLRALQPMGDWNERKVEPK